MKEKRGDNNPDRYVSVCIECGAKSPQVHGLWCTTCWNDQEQARDIHPADLLKPDRRETSGGSNGK